MSARTKLTFVTPITISGVLLLSATLMGFRVSMLENLELVLNNVEYWLSVFSAGFAFSLAESHVRSNNHAYWHIHSLAIIVSISATTGALAVFHASSLVIALSVPVAAGFAHMASKSMMKVRPIGNFLFALWLGALVLMWLIGFLTNLSAHSPLSPFSLFLLGKISINTDFFWLGPALILFLSIGYLSVKKYRSEIILAIWGVALSIAGPIVLLGWVTRWIVERLPRCLNTSVSRESSQTLGLISGLLGGSLFCFLVATSQKILGGFTPAEGFSVIIISVPFLLYWNKKRLQAEFPSKQRAGIESVVAIGSLAVLAFALLHLHGIAISI